MPTYNSAQAQISDTVYGRKKSRDSYSTLPSSFTSFLHKLSPSSFCPGFDLEFSALYDDARFVACVREQRALPCSCFTFTNQTVSLLKFLPSMQAQPPFLATAILIYHPLLVQIQPAIRQTLILDCL